MVNNQPRRRRVLEPGDVLRVGEATMIFDVEQEQGERNATPSTTGKAKPEGK